MSAMPINQEMVHFWGKIRTVKAMNCDVLFFSNIPEFKASPLPTRMILLIYADIEIDWTIDNSGNLLYQHLKKSGDFNGIRTHHLTDHQLYSLHGKD